MTMCSDTLRSSDSTLTHDLVSELDLITDFNHIKEFREVSTEHLQRIGVANRGRLLFRSPGPVKNVIK